MATQNIYKYKKVKVFDEDEWKIDFPPSMFGLNRESIQEGRIKLLKNKVNELTIEQNHLMKDFELYKKAFKRHLTEDLNEAHN